MRLYDLPKGSLLRVTLGFGALADVEYLCIEGLYGKCMVQKTGAILFLPSWEDMEEGTDGRWIIAQDKGKTQ